MERIKDCTIFDIASLCFVVLIMICIMPFPALADEPLWAPQLLGVQGTVIYQNMPSFPSPYEGPHSFSFKDGEGHGHTETYGIYLGSRILPTVQAYLDLEQARGNGIGRAMGLGGMTHGDVLRTGSVDLGQDPYIARFYLRSFIPLSPETTTMERAMDQLPGQEPASRVEFKIGKMAASDDFDLNRYANNTRTQFLNWGLINNTAWDYAADTRGYTYGIVISYVDPRWRVAFGCYQMPTMANGNGFDGHLEEARGDNLEVTIRPKRTG